MLAAYQFHHSCFTPLGINTHVLAQNNNNNIKSLYFCPANPQTLIGFLGLVYFFLKLAWQCNPAVSDCVRRWHTEQHKQGSTVYFHSSLVQVPAVCCLRVIFPPCAKVFMHWRNLGRSVILLTHRNKRERQRDKGFSVFFYFLRDQRKPVILKAKIATPLLCVYTSLLRQSSKPLFLPLGGKCKHTMFTKCSIVFY